MNVPPIWFPIAYVAVGPSGDASGGEFDIVSVMLQGGAHGVGPCNPDRNIVFWHE